MTRAPLPTCSHEWEQVPWGAIEDVLEMNGYVQTRMVPLYRCVRCPSPAPEV
jgi:hypothetical protein